MQRVQYTYGRCRGKELCRITGITQQEIADISGYTKQEVSDWFNNKRPINLPAAYTISRIFKCHIEDLCEFVPREPPESRQKR